MICEKGVIYLVELFVLMIILWEKINIAILIMCKVLWGMAHELFIVCSLLISAQVHESDIGGYEKYLFAVVKPGAMHFRSN